VGAAWHVDDAGWLHPAERICSPNQDARPAGQTVRLIVIHAISLPPGEFAGDAVIALFTNRLKPETHPYFQRISGNRVSAHFFIRRDGAVVQLVSCLQRAWHAGASCWQGHVRCNDFSVGIELEGDDHTDFTLPQYASLQLLNSALRERFDIHDCVGHADIAPGRKTDPGPYFDWSKIA
jgi:AmpD protein